MLLSFKITHVLPIVLLSVVKRMQQVKSSKRIVKIILKINNTFLAIYLFLSRSRAPPSLRVSCFSLTSLLYNSWDNVQRSHLGKQTGDQQRALCGYSDAVSPLSQFKKPLVTAVMEQIKALHSHHLSPPLLSLSPPCNTLLNPLLCLWKHSAQQLLQ